MSVEGKIVKRRKRARGKYTSPLIPLHSMERD